MVHQTLLVKVMVVQEQHQVLMEHQLQEQVVEVVEVISIKEDNLE